MRRQPSLPRRLTWVANSRYTRPRSADPPSTESSWALICGTSAMTPAAQSQSCQERRQSSRMLAHWHWWIPGLCGLRDRPRKCLARRSVRHAHHRPGRTAGKTTVVEMKRASPTRTRCFMCPPVPHYIGCAVTERNRQIARPKNRLPIRAVARNSGETTPIPRHRDRGSTGRTRRNTSRARPA